MHPIRNPLQFTVFHGVLFACLIASCKPTKTTTEAVPDRELAIANADAALATDARATRTDVEDSGATVVTDERVQVHFRAWTDHDGVALLAKDCRVKARSSEPGYDDPITCEIAMAQSCAYDACFNRREDCRQDCVKDCTICDDKCGVTCDACKSKCADDACRTACAATTAACKQTCLKKSDHCETGDCNAAAVVCARKEKQRWDAAGCSCAKKIQPWVNACEKCKDGKDAGHCPENCWAAVHEAFPKCDIGYCVSSTDPSGSIEPMEKYYP